MEGESEAQSPQKVQTTKEIGKDGKEWTVKIGESGTKHSYSQEEKECFARVINETLKDDEICNKLKLIPISVENEDLFEACNNGIIFCKLVNKIQKDTVDDRLLKDTKSNKFQTIEIINLSLSAIKSVGIKVISIDAELIMKGTGHLILGLLWQLVKIILVKDIDLKKVPEIVRLAQDDEEMNDLLALSPEALLIRWVNWHLKNSKSDRRVTNLGKDVADGEVYTRVLHSIDPSCISLSNLSNDPNERAREVLKSAEKLGIIPFISSSDITTGNLKLNTVFTAEIFNHRHGLPPLDEAETQEFQSAVLVDDDVEGTREERSYRMWMNSLGIEGLHINNLYEEAKDGSILLKVMDKVQPGVVDWSKVEKAPGKHQIK